MARDTRRSGPLLAAALSAGLASEGASVVDIGVLPTPGVAHLSKADGVAAAMISASHNPFGDNGIKFFAPGGRKLDDPTEDGLEAQLARLEREGIPGAADRPVGGGVGLVDRDPTAGSATPATSRTPRSTAADSPGCASSSTARTAPGRPSGRRCSPRSARTSP